ncbi:phosphopantothenoylcysteine decarboxylase [Halobacillus litoralis]|uniref:phosphopantothenoylcysteine decarboxylase domain-containing protein n=1 Tax=Halobacillus litoralis TaxID=45668 RepID=UPI00273DCD9D|nr:phosphopantothenoylcysteine decarboxylase [Halobacillus litoralis]WLR47005.1 phosphopantothenoylcysteine decarboxylase [Halobacillus litoralis]
MTLVSGQVALDPPVGVNVIQITTAQEMHEEVLKAYPDQDLVIKSAAVADYRPKVTYDQKMKKKPGDYIVEMERTKDILMELGERKEHQYLVGFAAETTDVEQYGRQKLEKKNLDAIVINNVSEEGVGFGTDTNASLVITKKGEEVAYPLMSKEDLAENILLMASGEMESGNL